MPSKIIQIMNEKGISEKLKGAIKRKIVIPQGKWNSFDGQIITGPKTIEVKVQLNDLPYFEKIQ